MYLFCLGNHPLLAQWEITAVLGNVPFTTHTTGVLIEDKWLEGRDFQHLQKQLGGTREIVWLHDRVFRDWQDAIALLRDWIGAQSGREMTLVATQLDIAQRKAMLNDVKKCFDRPVRYRLDKRYLLAEGGLVWWWLEIAPGQFMFGHALSQQAVAEYSERDYGKPARSMLRGMLPPKLAQMMLNGAQISSTDIVWDPFCGTGTVLVEAALSGKKILGSDKDTAAVDASNENITALLTSQQRENILGVWQQDITKPWADLSQQATIIVAEGYLGKPQSHIVASPADLRGFWQDVEPLYQKFFTNLATSAIQRMVLATPIVQTDAGISRLALRSWNILLQAGWTVEFRSDYLRSNQIVGREISLLIRNSR